MVSTDASSLNMKTPPNNAYFQRAREIIGDRSQAEIDYDSSVVAHLSAGMDIKSAIRADKGSIRGQFSTLDSWPGARGLSRG